MDVYPLFSSNVVVIEVEESLHSLQKIKEYEFIDTKSPGSDNCLITKNRKILNDFSRIKFLIQKHFDNFKNNVLNYEKTKFEITTSWGTKLVQNCTSQFHSHMNCMYSGILYFDEYDSNSGMLEFETPFITQQIAVIPTQYNIVNARVYGFKPKKNLLVFFPSYLRHRITTHLSEKERYSLAFNFIPTGKIGEGDSYVDIVLNS